jgi:hypothetical protein
MNTKRLFLIPILLMVFSTLACSMQSLFVDPTPIVITATPLPATDTPIPPTDTLAPSVTNTVPATETVSPTNTVPPSDTPTATQTATNTPIPCNRAEFVADITVNDGDDYYVGNTFTKTWRIMNTGSCDWNSSYRLVFVSGDQMGAPSAKKFTSNIISNGSTVDISVDLTAPSSPGNYKGFFKLRDGNGNVFGIGPAGDTSFWVEIDAIKIKLVFTPQLFVTLKVPLFIITP